MTPIRPDAKSLLKASTDAHGGGATQIDVLSALVRWFAKQDPGVQAAVVRDGSGLPVQDERAVRGNLRFGQEELGEKKAVGPPRAGIESRTTHSRRGSGRVA